MSADAASPSSKIVTGRAHRIPYAIIDAMIGEGAYREGLGLVGEVGAQ